MELLLAKFCVLTTALLVVYRWTYRHRTSFHLNRWFLLSGIYLCFILPWIPLEYETENTLFFTSPVTTILLPENGTVALSHPQQNSLPWMAIFYGLGILFLLILRIMEIGRIFRTIRRGRQIVLPEYILVETSVTSPFSFARYILLPEGMDKRNREAILCHEQTHVTQCHYLDLWLCEIFCILQWFNPFAWLYKHYLMENHEYLADEAASQAIGKAHYRQVLTECWLRGRQSNFIHPFAYSAKLTRLAMLEKDRVCIPVKKSGIILILMLLAYGWLFAKPIVVAQPTASNSGLQLTGKIIDAQGTAILGASVVIKNKLTGTITDFDGNYVVHGAAPTDTLSVSMFGYGSIAIPLHSYPTKNGTIELNIQLQPKNE